MNDSVRTVSPNCYTLGRFGDPTPGITVRLTRKGEPYTPNVQVGDMWVERAQKGGFPYTIQKGGETGIVYRAATLKVSPASGGKPFDVLTKAASEVAESILIRVSVRTPNMKTIVVNDRELRLASGTMGGRMIAANGTEKFVEISNGGGFLVFYEDGWVRAFSIENSTMVEVTLTKKGMMQHRIDDMLSQLSAEAERWGGPRPQVQTAMIGKMLDLMRLTSRYDHGEGQDLRMQLIREFFLKLEPGVIRPMARALWHVVNDTDHVLLPMVEGVGYESQLPKGVADLSAAREKRAAEEAAMTPTEREERRLANIRKAEADRKAAEERRAGFKAQRKLQPKKASSKKPDGKKKKSNKGEDRKAA